jgi:hypothetical protein
MFRRIAWFVLSLSSSAAIAGHTLPLRFDHRVSGEMSTIRSWIFPDNGAFEPIKVSTQQMTMFGVAEANRSMKWQLHGFMPQPVGKYMLVRYRANGLLNSQLSRDYFLWARDFNGVGHYLLNQGDLVQDGQWHTAVIDLACSGMRASASLIAVQVSATSTPPAEAWIESISFSDSITDGASAICHPLVEGSSR